MRRIQRALPEARFVHVIRDGRDVATSRRRAGRPSPLPAGRRRAALEAARDLRPRERAEGVDALPRGPLRGAGRRHRGDAATGLRARRAALRRGDAELPRARRRAPRRDRPTTSRRGAGAASWAPSRGSPPTRAPTSPRPRSASAPGATRWPPRTWPRSRPRRAICSMPSATLVKGVWHPERPPPTGPRSSSKCA